MRNFPILCAAVTVLVAALPSPVHAQTAESDRVRVTDPGQLVRWGYAPDASDIWARIGHDTATISEGREGREPRGIFISNYWVTATGFSFHPLSHNGEYLKGPSLLVLNGGVVITGSERVMEAQYDLLDGARLRYMDIFGSNTHASQELVINTIERCLPFLTPGNPVETVLATSTVGPVGGNFVTIQELPGDGHVVNSDTCSYHSRVVFGSGGSAPGVFMQLAKVRAELAP